MDPDPSDKPLRGKKPRTLQSIAADLNLSSVAVKVIENGFGNSPQRDTEMALDELIERLLTLIRTEDHDVSKVSSILNFLKTVKDWNAYGKRHFVRKMIDVFLDELSSGTNDLYKSCYIQIITKFVQTTHFNEHSTAGLRLLEHIFTAALEQGKKQTTVDMKKLKALKIYILAMDLIHSSSSRVLLLFQKALISETFLRNKEGVVVLSYFFCKEASLVRTFQTIIREELAKVSKKAACAIGDVYFHSWILAAGTPAQDAIEKYAIQDLFARSMTLRRMNVKMNRLGTRVFQVLKAINANRRLKKFSGVVTKLYEPILWRSLKSANPAERSNAAQVFLNIFPLERVEGPPYEKKLYLERQIKEIKDLLVDDCFLVRILAVQGLGPVFLSSADLLGVNDLAEIMGILVDKLANDTSSPQVRASIFSMTELLMSSPTPRSLAITIMRRLPLHLFDEHKDVRKAFVKVLLAWSEVDDDDQPSIWDVISYKWVLHQLASERDSQVGTLLAKLVLPNVYEKDQDVARTVKLFTNIIKVSDVALARLFVNSKKLINVDDAFTMIVSVLATIGMQVNEKMEELARQAEEQENSSSPPPRKKSKKEEAPLGEITDSVDPNGQPSTEAPQARTQKPCLIDNHPTVIALLNGVCALWATFSEELENSSHYESLCALSISQVPRFLKHFKDTLVYYAVVNFASFLPIQSLSKQSTIAGACLSELKQKNIDSDPSIVNCLVKALCFWSRGNEIFELVMDWLNEVFRHEDLNNTAILLKKGQKSRTVKFKSELGKPEFGIQLLENIFQHNILREKIVKTNYEHLTDLFEFIGRIKDLIVRRLQKGKPLKEPNLNDGFLLRCFNVYLDLIAMLHQPEGGSVVPCGSSALPVPLFNSISVSTELLSWAEGLLITYSDAENGQLGFASKCLKSVLEHAHFLIGTNRTDKEHLRATVKLVLKISSFNKAWPFLEIFFKIIQAVGEHAIVYTVNDEWKILGEMVPELLNSCLKHCSSITDPATEITPFVEDTNAFHLSIVSVVPIYETFHGRNHRQFKVLCGYFISTMVDAIMKEIVQNDAVLVISKWEGHPYFVSVFAKYFVNKPTLIELMLPMLITYLENHKTLCLNVLGCTQLTATFLYLKKNKLPARSVENMIDLLSQIWDTFKETKPDLHSVGSNVMANLKDLISK